MGIGKNISKFNVTASARKTCVCKQFWVKKITKPQNQFLLVCWFQSREWRFLSGMGATVVFIVVILYMQSSIFEYELITTKHLLSIITDTLIRLVMTFRNIQHVVSEFVDLFIFYLQYLTDQYWIHRSDWSLTTWTI